jgi:hypothetical protein
VRSTSEKNAPVRGAIVMALAILGARMAAAAPPAIDLGALDGTFGFAVHGAAAGEQLGFSSAIAGDVGGDGLGEVHLGAFGASPHGFGAGRSYLVFGSPIVRSPVFALLLDGADGFAMNGIAEGDFAGISVASAGDLNDDGLEDVVVGAYAADPHGASSGQVYVVFGTRAPFPSVLELADLDGASGFTLNGVESPNRTGSRVTGGADVNGDGIDDLLIGAHNAQPAGLTSGAAYVVFGRRAGFPAVVELADLAGTDGFAVHGAVAGDLLGVGLALPGDLDGDGFGEVVIGASGATSNGIPSGTAYVIRGAAGFPPLIDAGDVDGAFGFEIHGAGAGASLGVAAARAGDVNGDGRPDLLLGADGAVAGAGAAYVVYGRASAFAGSFSVTALDGTSGFALVGAAAGDATGAAVSGAGDFDGDGLADLVVGARAAAGGSGRAYLVRGRRSFPAAVEIATLGAGDAIAFDAAQPGDAVGTSVGGGGDVNGDGRADVVIGAPNASPFGFFSGAAYVVFGSGDCDGGGVLDVADVMTGALADDDDDGVPDVCACPEDVSGDGSVGFADLLAVLAAWGPCRRCDEDVDGDGTVGFRDLLAVLAAWGPC